ncbi:ATP-binding cassette domain-containing protein [Photobacterium sanguinicancri]|uniref:ATP-binding cassette domain-containing protein n=1 Tax=Photobacterium sanguinicancri TaxID=875932 RepID=UPI0026E32556|nr:ATP-binding cassette domain-containing protein [Photobacterium sanguinicancri]MDO6496598.1 ATP-binding cassette domain-containing protein [Photobacterium sanguinicancri]
MSLSVENLTISNTFASADSAVLVNALNFSIDKGEILTIMGPSGCGKSTLLSAIAGHLVSAFSLSGDITLNNSSILDLEPNERRVGILFQDDLLFPHLTVWENLAFGLPQNIRYSARKARAFATLVDIDLVELAEKMPSDISGGQRARISLMRTLLSEPQALLLDEPFSKLDKALRETFRAFVFQQIQRSNIPAVMVSHDVDDIPYGGAVLEWPWTQGVTHA